ncbi:MAG: YqiA/YcfP family alpha/beta fold hydrolase, partial [Bacteroidota bacterium]
GSSAGGLMAYWLARYLDCKALLFNPALNFFKLRPDLQEWVADAPQNGNFYYHIVLGEKDDVVDPAQTLNYLEEKENQATYEIHPYPELGHRIDLDTFQEACQLIA